MQQESREGLSFLCADGKVEDMPRELVNIQATHAETVLELQKTRNLLLVEHQISKDLKVESKYIYSQQEGILPDADKHFLSFFFFPISSRRKS